VAACSHRPSSRGLEGEADKDRNGLVTVHAPAEFAALTTRTIGSESGIVQNLVIAGTPSTLPVTALASEGTNLKTETYREEAPPGPRIGAYPTLIARPRTSPRAGRWRARLKIVPTHALQGMRRFAKGLPSGLQLLNPEALKERQEQIASMRPVITHPIVRLNLEALSNRIDDLLMLLHGLGWDWPPLECEHSRTVGLVHNRFGDSRDAAISAAFDEQAMEFIIGFGPRDQIILL
jgi:hypothetical protein